MSAASGYIVYTAPSQGNPWALTPAYAKPGCPDSPYRFTQSARPIPERYSINYPSKPITGGAANRKQNDGNRSQALAKAIGFITPAILLARYAPSKVVRQELIPSDWKVWAKMLLGVASLNQVNQALNWQPPPWLNAMLNVSVITPLIAGVSKQALKPLLVLAPAIGGLVQATHWVSNQAETPLQDNYNIPPWATRLGLSVASMGVCFWALPNLSRLSTLGLSAKQNSAAATSTVVSTCASGCCTGSVLCMNELANCGSALGSWLYNTVSGKQAKP